jgi:biotin-(acetyl-CoA carboxylase) ligase
MVRRATLVVEVVGDRRTAGRIRQGAQWLTDQQVLALSASVSTGKKVPGDKNVARRVINFLEDRRLLFGERHGGDEMHCVQ